MIIQFRKIYYYVKDQHAERKTESSKDKFCRNLTVASQLVTLILQNMVSRDYYKPTKYIEAYDNIQSNIKRKTVLTTNILFQSKEYRYGLNVAHQEKEKFKGKQLEKS